MLKQILLFCFVCFISAIAFCQAHIYTFKLHDVTDAEQVKAAMLKLRGMFDVTPTFNFTTHVFYVKSESDISEELFTEKSALLGFTVDEFSHQDSAEIIYHNE